MTLEWHRDLRSRSGPNPCAPAARSSSTTCCNTASISPLACPAKAISPRSTRFYDARDSIRLIACRQKARRLRHGRGLRQADGPAGHLLRHARPRRHQRGHRPAYRLPGFDADDPVHRPGRARLSRPRGVPGDRLPAHVRPRRQMGRRRSTMPSAFPIREPAPSIALHRAARARWCWRCPKTC